MEKEVIELIKKWKHIAFVEVFDEIYSEIYENCAKELENVMNKKKLPPCPDCGRKGLHHPRPAYLNGMRDFDKVVCRFCKVEHRMPHEKPTEKYLYTASGEEIEEFPY